MIEIIVRKFEDDDAEATAELFYQSVHQLTQDHYNEQQRHAWAPEVPETSGWLSRLKSQTTFVAEQDSKLIGFMTITSDGYIDLAYVAPEAVGIGVAKRLYDIVETQALEFGAMRLRCEASHLARQFFIRQGWSVIKEQSVSRNGVNLTNFIMEKILSF